MKQSVRKRAAAAGHVIPGGGRRSRWVAVVAVAGTMAGMAVITACGKRADADDASAHQPSMPGRMSVTPSAHPDTDVTAKGATHLPAGYAVLLDNPSATIVDASYTAEGTGRWEVRTGPAHLLYSPADTARKHYSVTATFEQIEAPAHPEAYGVFIGGSALENLSKPRYTYFLVRGDGKYMVKVHDGTKIRTITDWTAHPAVPRQDAAGKAVYGIKVDVDAGMAKVSVNGKPVTTISGKNGPLDGIAGVRINHNLHLMVTPVSVIRVR